MPLTVVQTLPALDVGGVERGTLEVAAELVRKGHRSIVISAGGRLVDRLIKDGSEHFTMPIGKKSFFTLKYIARLRRYLSEQNVSILHARSRLPAWISYLAWKGMDPGKRPCFVTTVHGPYTVNRYSKIMTRGQRVIAISGFIRDYIIENYPDTDKDRIEIIYRGVSRDQFPYGFRPSQDWMDKWRAQYPALSGKFIITLPARVTPWKGQEDFIKIVVSALREDLPVHGLVAGGYHSSRASFFKQLRTRVGNAKIDKHITFLGHRNDLREIMSVSDTVLSLAKIPEAFGRTALESLCLGTPVIAYDHGGAAEVLKEIFPRGLIKPHDIKDATMKLMEFYKMRPVVPAHNPFTLEKMLEKTIHLYEKLSETAPA